MRSDYLNSIEITDLSPDLQLLAQLLGMEAMRPVLEQLSGFDVRIPNPSRLHAAVRRYIRTNYQQREEGGDNAHELALDTGLSVVIVRRHAGAPRRGPRRPPLVGRYEGQENRRE